MKLRLNDHRELKRLRTQVHTLSAENQRYREEIAKLRREARTHEAEIGMAKARCDDWAAAVEKLQRQLAAIQGADRRLRGLIDGTIQAPVERKVEPTPVNPNVGKGYVIPEIDQTELIDMNRLSEATNTKLRHTGSLREALLFVDEWLDSWKSSHPSPERTGNLHDLTSDRELLVKAIKHYTEDYS